MEPPILSGHITQIPVLEIVRLYVTDRQWIQAIVDYRQHTRFLNSLKEKTHEKR